MSGRRCVADVQSDHGAAVDVSQLDQVAELVGQPQPASTRSIDRVTESSDQWVREGARSGDLEYEYVAVHPPTRHTGAPPTMQEDVAGDLVGRQDEARSPVGAQAEITGGRRYEPAEPRQIAQPERKIDGRGAGWTQRCAEEG